MHSIHKLYMPCWLDLKIHAGYIQKYFQLYSLMIPMIPPVQQRVSHWLEPSSPIEIQSKEFLDCDQTDLRYWQTRLGHVRTDLLQCPWLGSTFPDSILLMRKVYLDGAE